MKFLCLHGHGTNANVLKLQTSPLRHELGDGHEYEFVQGNIDTTMPKGVEAFSSAGDSFYALWSPYDLSTFDKALEHLDKYIAVEGPFDAVLGFSAGAVLGALYLAHTQRRGLSLPFKCGVFLASGNLADELNHVGLDVWSLENRIRLPSAHIWGSADTVAPKGGPELLRLFDPAQSHVLVHDGGHEVPKNKYVTEATNLIRRVVAMADD